MTTEQQTAAERMRQAAQIAVDRLRDANGLAANLAATHFAKRQRGELPTHY